MFSGILESLLVFKQFLGTGFLFLALAGIALFCLDLFELPERWVHSGIGVFAFLMIVAPHGWYALMGKNEGFVYYDPSERGIPQISEGSLLQADLMGVFVGAAVAYGVYFYLKHRPKW